MATAEKQRHGDPKQRVCFTCFLLCVVVCFVLHPQTRAWPRTTAALARRSQTKSATCTPKSSSRFTKSFSTMA